jgi:hypothetical protein
MQRRKVVWIVSLLALAGTVLLFAWIVSRDAGRRLNRAGLSQLRLGMTQAQVESLLGGPPGNYGRYARGMMTLEGYSAPPGAVERIWCDDSNRLEIYFDAEGRVVGHHRRARYSQSPPEGVYAWLQQVIGL